MANPLELTFYARTGYSPNDEPASDAVIDANAHWTSPLRLQEYDPAKLEAINVEITDGQLRPVDYLKITDTVTGERYYYYILTHKRINGKVVNIRVALDAFASVGLANIAFYGNITRRSLSQEEAEQYPRLAEPWAPKRPLKTRRVIIDVNTNKTVQIPAHIATSFEDDDTEIAIEKTIDVPQTPLGVPTETDSLSLSALLPAGYPTVAGDTTHTTQTPWGNLVYTTPYETYYNLSGSALSEFLAKAKKYNALDLIEQPYYLPSPGNATVTISEFNQPKIKNKKAYKYYVTMTIRGLASNTSKVYDDQSTDLNYQQTLDVIVVPDKAGGIYVIPDTIRDTGLNAYTYLDGVYSPFETVVYNAVGDTPAKFAADGTVEINTQLNALFESYIDKINAMQMENMRFKYYKDLGTVKGQAMAFVSELVNSASTSTTYVNELVQTSDVEVEVPKIVQDIKTVQKTPQYKQKVSSVLSNPAVRQESSSKTDFNTVTQTINTRQDAYLVKHPATTQTQSAYSYTPSSSGTISIPQIKTETKEYYESIPTIVSRQDITISNPNVYQSGSVNIPGYDQTQTGTTTIDAVNVDITGTQTSNAYKQISKEITRTPGYQTTSITNMQNVGRDVDQNVSIAEAASKHVHEVESWDSFKTLIFGGYRNEMHSFMLGNINDYINRWAAIQNDIHNGKVANLFKNVTLLGNYASTNRLAGKYEILITSLQDEDIVNFDLFLQHFGHAVDEYSSALIRDAGGNYNYVMVGEDAIISNAIHPDLNARLLQQARAGLRVWKTLIRPENY